MTQALQLYAPFVGLMALAFWMVVLSQRVRQLEKSALTAALPDIVTIKRESQWPLKQSS